MKNETGGVWAQINNEIYRQILIFNTTNEMREHDFVMLV